MPWLPYLRNIWFKNRFDGLCMGAVVVVVVGVGSVLSAAKTISLQIWMVRMAVIAYLNSVDVILCM